MPAVRVNDQPPGPDELYDMANNKFFEIYQLVQSGLASFDNLSDEQQKKVNEAVALYNEAAAQGHVTAMVHLADFYFHGDGVTQDYERAFQLHLKASDLGSALSSCNVGIAYQESYGCERDHGRALEYLIKATEQDPELYEAWCALGCFYDRDFSDMTRPVDHALAVMYYTKAVEKGSGLACKNLAIKYQNGEGVEKDRARSRELFDRWHSSDECIS